jgi:hypothetical protein
MRWVVAYKISPILSGFHASGVNTQAQHSKVHGITWSRITG